VNNFYNVALDSAAARIESQVQRLNRYATEPHISINIILWFTYRIKSSVNVNFIDWKHRNEIVLLI